MKKYIPTFLLSVLVPAFGWSQERIEKDALSYRIEAFGSLSTGDNTPFWMTSNRYGMVPLKANNTYLKAGVFHQHHFGKGFRWGVGLDMAVAVPRDKNAYIHQIYAELGYKCLELTVGSKEQYLSLKNSSLSSGDMILSKNARPIPGINISIPKFTNIPLTKGWLQVKGNFSVSKSFDTNFLEDRFAQNYTFVEDVLWHHKALYLQLKDTRNGFPLSANFGLQHVAQWGGTSTNPKVGEQPHSFKDFIRIMVGSKGGNDASMSDQINVLGSHHISFDFGLKYEADNWNAKGYYQHLCYDKSGMLFRNGTDGLWGMEVELPKLHWLDHFVFEYVTTRNQSGPFHYISFDHVNHPGRGGGGDNYYNNEEYITGNSYFGKGIGSPLIVSPEYNTNGSPEFLRNRVQDWHFGLSGSFSKNVSYRMLLTFMNNWGTGQKPLLKKATGTSLLADVYYQHQKLEGWQFGASIGADTGNVFGKKSTGFSLTIRKNGLLKKYKSK